MEKKLQVTLASLLAISMIGCSSEDNSENSGNANDQSQPIINDGGNEPDQQVTQPFEPAQFVLISSDGTPSDITFDDSTVGEWSTGSQANGAATFDGLDAWSVKSGSKTAEQGNWGTVLAFQSGILGDFSLFTHLKLKIATTGGYTEGYRIALTANGVSKELAVPVNDASSTWQEVSIDLNDFALNLSSIDSLAVMAVGGTPSVSTIYVTDLILTKEHALTVDQQSESDFVFKSSDPSVSSLVVDGDSNSNAGNVIMGEWSTGTVLSDCTYEQLDCWQLTAGGSWGAVLALQGDISDGTNIDNYDVDLSQYTNLKFKMASEGAFDRYAVSIISNNSGKEATHEVGFSLATPAQWNTVDINLDSFGVDLSNVNQLAVFGVYEGGTSAGQKVYITDMVAYDSGISPQNEQDSSDDKFVFISSTGESIDLIVDDNNFANDGNITISEWSTGSAINNGVDYDGLPSWEIVKGSGWGAVVAFTGDINGSVQPYSIDLTQYSALNLKLAAAVSNSTVEVAFITTEGAQFNVPLVLSSDWTGYNVNLSEIPLNLNHLSQIAIYGIGDQPSERFYIADMNITK